MQTTADLPSSGQSLTRGIYSYMLLIDCR